MAVVIRAEEDGQSFRKLIIYIIVITAIVIIIYLFWRYILLPFSRGTLFPPAKVSCTETPSSPSNLSGAAAARNRAIIQWTATANTDDYTLYVGRAPGFATGGAERTIKVIGASVAVLNLLPVTYYFKVAANNSCGTSAVSNEISVTITEFPATFKLCKLTDPTLCLIFQGNDLPAGITATCSTGPCEFTHPGMTSIRSLNDNLCLFSNPLGLVNAEEPVESEVCNNPTTWNINFANNRVTTFDNLCLGANNIEASVAYNTNCTVISNPDDERYSWVLQPTTN